MILINYLLNRNYFQWFLKCGCTVVVKTCRGRIFSSLIKCIVWSDIISTSLFLNSKQEFNHSKVSWESFFCIRISNRKKKKKKTYIIVINDDNIGQQYLPVGAPFNSVERAPHVQRLCPRCSVPGFDSRPGALCFVSLPLSLIPFPVTAFAILSLKKKTNICQPRYWSGSTIRTLRRHSLTSKWCYHYHVCHL